VIHHSLPPGKIDTSRRSFWRASVARMHGVRSADLCYASTIGTILRSPIDKVVKELCNIDEAK